MPWLVGDTVPGMRTAFPGTGTGEESENDERGPLDFVRWNVEGIVKYRCEYTPRELPEFDLEDLIRWRNLLKAQRLLGQDPDRYGGYGFGNVSMRVPPYDSEPAGRRFVISGTQTGGLDDLTKEDFSLVVACHPRENLVIAEGPAKPSSEALTHGTIYALDVRIRFVFHVHSPDLWHRAAHLRIPVSDPSVPYGSPEMASEVARLYDEGLLASCGFFSMGGHEDGLVSFGRSADEAGHVVLERLQGLI